MKKIVFTLVLSAGITTISFAQQGNKQHTGNGQHAQGGQHPKGQKMTPEQRAEKLTQYMTTALTLTGDQVSNVSALNMSKAKQVDSIHKANKANMEAAKPEIKKVKTAYNTSLNSILTTDQKTKWEALKKQKREEMQKAKAAGTKPVEGQLTPEDIE